LGGDQIQNYKKKIGEKLNSSKLTLSYNILNYLNESTDQIHQIREIIHQVREFNDFEAVGIRIKKNEHFPYFESNGFSDSYLKMADHFCKNNLSHPSKALKYECMCRRIINQNINPELPCFTEHGSFWTNNLHELLEKNPDGIRKSFTIANCQNSNYQSVAIVPIKNKEEVIGLLQINDKRTNIFSEGIVHTIENVGSSIGIAFARDQAISELKTNERRYRLAQRAADIGSWDWDIVSSELTWSEKIEPMFGFKKGEFEGTYDAFINCVHPDDREFVKKSVNECLEQEKRYAIEHRIIWSDGTIRWVSERGDVIRDNTGKPERMLGVVQDITKRREMEDELKHRKESLKKQVEERTTELVLANKKLKEEIDERKKTEHFLERTKQNLRNVIDSATEFIVSFDTMNRVSIWNRTAEYLTNYKQIDVLNRSIGKLNVFDDPDKLIETINLICEHKGPRFFDLVLKTKENDTRVVRVYPSMIKGYSKECVGSLLMGKDITDDVALHKKLLPGNSYLITSKDNLSSFDLLSELTLEGNSGLIITRGNPEQIKQQVTISENMDIAFLTKKPLTGMINLSDFEAVLHEVNIFTQKKKKPMILLEGVHYLLSHYSFDSFINLLYDINDIIVDCRAMLFVRIDPATINRQQMALIENELLNLPGQKTEDIIITDDLFNLIKYIYKQNQNNMMVSVKKVMSEFDITYVTAASRIDELEGKELIYSKKQGKIRAIFVSNRGKKLIHKRKTS
jgi:PAS domain S-box-containing protein